MWSTVVSIIGGLISAIEPLLNFFDTRQTREDGRRELELEQAEKQINDLKTAAEIDSRPTPADERDILDRM